jgi:DNA helicase-2/ATP-dependent DNA helicase PcrA
MATTASAQRSAVADRWALSVEQRRVVEHGDGALLVFAGPGSGKTRTLTARIAALLDSGRARPSEILALTFTVRASEEMRVRLTALVGQGAAADVTVATFHSLGARILRPHAAAFGRTNAFSIYDSDDLLHIARDLRGDDDDATREAGEEVARELVTEISRAKAQLWTPERLRAQAANAEHVRLATQWERLEQELRRCNAFDLADLVTRSVELLTRDRAVRDRQRARWRHIVVDEFQDTDTAQCVLLERLAGPGGCAPNGSLVVAGDDDQLLYGWRGARVENLLDFRRAYPCATELVLRRNYRCRPEILAAASSCIAHNTRRRDKALIAARPAGGTVDVARFGNDHQEAAVLARRIDAVIARGVDAREILVLCRSLRYTRPLQQALTSAGIAHRVIGARSFWERVEVRDALAYVALVANPHDGVAFRRAVGAPTDRRQFAKAGRRAPSRGVGPATQHSVVEHARRANIDIIEACATAGEWLAGGVDRSASPSARAALAIFGEQLAAVRRDLLDGASVAKSVIGALTILGGPVQCYDDLLQSAENAEVAEDCLRVKEDLRSLCRAAHSHDDRFGDEASLVRFLHETRVEPGTALDADADTRLTISTIHAAKGTEAHVVMVLGCEERLLPTGYAIDSADPMRVDEERRAFYVAATRAADSVTFTVAAQRLGEPTAGPSRFLAECGGGA